MNSTSHSHSRSRSRSYSRALLAAVCSLAATGAAQAANNTVELQLDPAPLIKLAVSKAREQAPCPQVLAGDTWLDHMEFPAVGGFVRLAPGTSAIDLGNGTSVQGRKAQLVLPTIVETKTSACIDTVGCDGAQTSFEIMFGLRVQRLGANAAPQLCAAVDDVSLAAPLHDPVLTKLKALIPETCVDLEVPVPTDALELDFAGAAVSTNGTRLAMRIAFGAAGGGDFGSFLNGTIGPGTATGFSLFVDRHLFMDPLQDRAAAALAELPSELSLRSGPTASWVPQMPIDGRPAIGLGIGLDLPICSIDVDADIAALFSLEQNAGQSELVMEVVSEVDIDEVALGFCTAGLVLLGAPFVPGLEFIAIAGATVAVDAVEGLGVGMLPIPNCTVLADNRQECRFAIDLPEITLGGNGHGTLALQTLTGHAQGLLLGGTFTAPSPIGQIAGVPGSTAVTFGSTGSCDSGFSSGYQGYASVSGQGYKVCGGSTKVGDPQGVYTVSGPAVGSNLSADFTVTFNEATATAANFFAAPYPAKVKMVTSGGVFTVQLAAPPKATDSEKLTAALKGLKNRITCDYQTRSPGPRPGWFDPRWNVDPPYDYVVSLSDGVNRPTAARATITNLRLASDSRSALDGSFSLLTQGTALADLVVGYTSGGRIITFTAPISFAVSQTMTATRLAAGSTRLALSTALAPTVAIPAASLPAAFRSGSAVVRVPTTSVTFEGIMR